MWLTPHEYCSCKKQSRDGENTAAPSQVNDHHFLKRVYTDGFGAGKLFIFAFTRSIRHVLLVVGLFLELFVILCRSSGEQQYLNA
ncbi:hypothetical protein Y032_0445g1580 [Ancylostoma ceylanicum]|uniref:Uncharacterized protein n=1 Tax=Ancylostoma ceylanicum TaxID=53326 RepID=A0A016WZ24_9BILA|nr:hypothetical protein Y032_0445g1580 [Ancylostoma ceylanicum]